ncbi:MAG: F0F1 ATP synthase subunit B [Erysipelotrichaceae bacterium]|nr:F0F1 ATP synthase subunit B [Erysipelotrichaceae bacterium]
MNVDVQGSLFPNLISMITQLCATGLIFLAVKKWLWKPVRNILEKRACAMQESLDSAFKTNEEAKANLDDAKEELKKAKKDSLDIIAGAKKEADALKAELIVDAKKQAQAKIDEADKRIEAAKKEMTNELHDEIVNVAMAAVEKLLEEKVNEATDRESIDKFVKEAGK